MKQVFVTDDQRTFDNELDARTHEAELNQYIPVPLSVLREALRQATPYMVSAKERRELCALLQPLVDGAPDRAKYVSETHAEFGRVLAALNELAPMADSNDMNWTYEAMRRIEAIRLKLAKETPTVDF